MRSSSSSPGPYRQGFGGYWAANNFTHRYYEGFYYRDTFDRVDIDGYEPHTQTDVVVNYMRQAKDREAPFVLFLSWGPPHNPWSWDSSPETFNHLFEGRAFPDPPNYSDDHARYWSPRRDEEWWMENWKPHRFQDRQGYAAQTASLDWKLGRLLAAMDEMGLGVRSATSGTPTRACSRTARNISSTT